MPKERYYKAAQLKYEKERREQEEKARKAKEAAQKLKESRRRVKSSGNWMQKHRERSKPKAKPTKSRYFQKNTLHHATRGG